jgi:hypothetical protein
MGVGGEADSRRARNPGAMSATHIEHTTTRRQRLAPFSARERVKLAEREFDGISVELHWTRGTDIVTVTVADATTGDHFELVVAENERPLEVFHHPFAYARARGIELLGDRHGAGAAV